MISFYRSCRLATEAMLAADRIVLAGHINPDGDTLGSMLALTHALRALGKTAVPLSHHGVPDIYKWLPGAEWVQNSTDERGFDLAVVCDTGTSERVGGALPAIESADRILCIDHHLAEGKLGDIRVVNAKVAATGELIYRLLRPMGAHLSKEIADCLMCAIITDTGAFRFMNVTPNTFRTAAALMRAGACPAEIGELVFENKSLGSIKLMGRAIDSIQLTPDGRAAWGCIKATDFEEMGLTDEDSEGIVNHIRAVRTAQVGVLFREVPGKKVRVSLRAREGYDVNRVAQAFGGGGHMLAAGCSVDPPLSSAVPLVMAEVTKWLS